MIEITLSELDISLETTEVPDFTLSLEESSGDVALQGPLDFGQPSLEPSEWGTIDLDLLGFPYHGLSAYEVALGEGFVGTKAEWLASLVGPPGTLSPEGLDAVARAEAAAQTAAGHANASAGSVAQAAAYSGVAGEWAAASLEHQAQALAYRDATGQIAAAVAVIRQEAEAYATDAGSYANAAIIAKVAAETERAQAAIARQQAVNAATTAQGSAASASDNAIMAVNARNLADDAADAAVLSESAAATYADNARVEAEASRNSQISATAAKDEAQITAAAVVIDKATVSGYVTDAAAQAEAARLQKVAAEAANAQAGTRAAAALQSQQTATAQADLAGQKATAADGFRATAATKAGEAVISAQQAAQSVADASGQRVLAEAARDISVTARNASQGYASASAGYRDTAQIYADTSGQIYGVLSGRVDAFGVRLGTAEGNITTANNIAVDALGKVNATVGVTLNANGYVSGTRLSNNGVTSSFTVIGDQFYLVNPNNGSPFRPFVVDGNQVTFNANVRINGVLIIDGTIETPRLANNSVTIIDSVTQTANFVGQGFGGSYYDEESGQWIYYGGKQTIISYTIYLPYAAKLVCISSFTHNYTASGTPGFNYDISVDGGGIVATGGSGVRVVGSSVSGYANLGPGYHTITTNWQGDTGVISLNYANLVIMAVFK